MNPYKARKMAKVIALIIVLAMVITSFSVVFVVPSLFGEDSYVVYAAETADITDAQLAAEAKTLQDYLKYIKANYKDDVTLEMLMEGAFSGGVDVLGDPYSVYYKNEVERDDFLDSVEGEFSGVGIVMLAGSNNFEIDRTIAGGPAEQAGVLAGDRITHVNGISVGGKTTDELTAALRGESGTVVPMTVQRGDKTLTFQLTRSEIKTDSVTYKMLDNGIGYVKISSFDNDTNVEFDSVRNTLLEQGAKSYILDLRNNPGGYVHTAINTANRMMPAGVILYMERQGKIEETVSADGVDVMYPTVLLVNEGTGSSAEFFAGALQDSKTAKVVGTQTYGKGIVQEVIDINDKSALKLSTAYVLTPNKKRIDKVGITPDYVVNNYDAAEKQKLVELYRAFAPMKEKTKPAKGDTGLNVYGAQQRLNLLGYKVEISGTMDQAATDAVKAFQKQSGLNPYGVLDFTTQKTLDKAVYDNLTGLNEKVDAQLNKAIELLK